jgi:hypothetical protein
MKTLIYITIIFFCIVLSNCKNDKKEDPIPTTPKNTWSQMSCKLDGKDWSDCGKTIIGTKESNTGGEWFKNFVNQPLKIYGITNCDNNNSFVNIYLADFKSVAVYHLANYNNVSYTIQYPAGNVEYKTNSSHIGTLSITKFDSIRNKVSGTFSFEGFNADSNRIVKITDGKFTDISFYVN